ncbi:DUF6318 family protein [Aeromicrobium sp. CTD01-1L150]|uniref:DUF6318 family protein n=1 Tax=Aeromicrobium sp. CTD01-1L150 TaxID=3341830 RepID=UPI0035C02BD9
MRRTVTLVIAALLLAACNGKPEVREPDPSDSPTASAAPTMPAQAKEDSDEGAAAFVAHWIDVFNFAARTGEIEPLTELGPNCEACNNYAKGLQENFEAGDAPEHDLWTFNDLLVGESQDDKIDLQVRVEAEYADGREEHELGFELERSEHYEVADIYVIEEDS